MDYNYTPRANIGATIGAYQDTQVRKAELDNMKAQRNAIATRTIGDALTNDYNRLTMKDRHEGLRWATELKKDQSSYLDNKWRHEIEMFPHQLQAIQAGNKRLDAQTDLIYKQILNSTAKTEYQNLVNDLYNPGAWAGIASKAAGAMGNIGKMFKRGTQKTPTMNKANKERNIKIDAMWKRLND